MLLPLSRIFDIERPISTPFIAVIGAVDSDEAKALINQTTLSNSEEQRALRFAFEQDRQCFKLGRAILRQVAAWHENITPAQVKIAIDEAKKPYLCDSGLKFSIAHSANYVAVAFSTDQEIGADLELGKSLRSTSLQGIARKVFTNNEQALLADLLTLPDDAQARAFFLSLWRRKEAVLKAFGTGLAGGASTIEMLDTNEEFLNRIRWRDRNWVVEDHQHPDLPSLAIALG